MDLNTEFRKISSQFLSSIYKGVNDRTTDLHIQKNKLFFVDQLTGYSYTINQNGTITVKANYLQSLKGTIAKSKSYQINKSTSNDKSKNKVNEIDNSEILMSLSNIIKKHRNL